jgi:hypothetical protein
VIPEAFLDKLATGHRMKVCFRDVEDVFRKLHAFEQSLDIAHELCRDLTALETIRKGLEESEEYVHMYKLLSLISVEKRQSIDVPDALDKDLNETDVDCSKSCTTDDKLGSSMDISTACSADEKVVDSSDSFNLLEENPDSRKMPYTSEYKDVNEITLNDFGEDLNVLIGEPEDTIELRSLYSKMQSSGINDYAQAPERSFDFLLKGKVTEVLHFQLKNLMNLLALKKSQSKSNGHCILYSWVKSTGIRFSKVKMMILTEFYSNPDRYEGFNISYDELVRYLTDKEYNMDSVDSVLAILVNACKRDVYILEDLNGTLGCRVTKLACSCVDGEPKKTIEQKNQSVFLLKAPEHYDALIKS